MRSSLKIAEWVRGAGPAALACGALVACAPKAEVKPEQPAVQVAAPPPKAESTPDELNKAAQDRIAAKDYSGAQASLDAALAKDPNNAEALFASGWVAEQQGKNPLAIADYKKALAAQPEHLGAALNVARLYRLLDDYSDGEQVLHQSLQVPGHEADPALLNALAGLLRLDKKLDEAEATVRKVLARHPDNADAYKNLALIELDRGKPRLAEVALQSARKLDANDPGIANNLGLLAWNRGEVAQAREKFNEAVKLDGSYAPAWANLGALALSYRDYNAAAEAYAKATALDPNRWDEELAYGWALEGQKKPVEAQAAYEKVLAMKPGQDDALFGKATALKAQNKLPEAMAAFQSYVQLPAASHGKDAQSQIAQIDMRLKNPPKKAPAPEPKRESNPSAGSDISQLALPAGQTPTTEAPAAGAPLPPADDAAAALPPAPAPAPQASPAVPTAPAPSASAPAPAPDAAPAPAAGQAASPAPEAPAAAPAVPASKVAGPTGAQSPAEEVKPDAAKPEGAKSDAARPDASGATASEKGPASAAQPGAAQVK